MQRKYNMALQHFYQAATHNANDDEIETKKKLSSNLSSGSEEELFNSEKYKQECFEMRERSNADVNENTYFKFKKEANVKHVKPVSVCSLQGCGLVLLWFILFAVGVVGITYFLQLAIRKIEPRTQATDPVVYERYKTKETSSKTTNNDLESCSHFHVKKVWNKAFDKFQTESAMRLLDANQDGVDDIIFGFVTSLDSYGDVEYRKKLCKKYYDNIFPCFGGVVAVDGKTGDAVWKHFALHDIYAVNCNGDINNDGVADCLCAGRGGAFEVVSGKDGKLLWVFLSPRYRDEMMNLYTPQFIYDIDNDGVMDVLISHGGDLQATPFSKVRKTGKLLFISGKTGVVLKSATIPDNAETYFSPIIYTSKNGTEIVVFGTGGETHKGSLYIIQLKDLYAGKIKDAIKLLSDNKKGYMNPPVLVDINNDGVVDLINPGYMGIIQAIDGETLKVLWTYSKNWTETYSIPAAGYYNDDDVVDFFVRLNRGPGFPVYFDSKVIILNGMDGTPISKEYKTSAPAHSSPLAVSMEGSGNDLFLHWSVDCLDHEHEGGEFRYVPGTNVHESSRSDSCTARYGTKSFSKFFVMNRKTGLPGKPIYFSGDYFNLEHGVQDVFKKKRHIGVPDHGGVQRIIQTGVISKSLNENPDRLSSKFDVIFAMYYLKPPVVRAIRPSDQKCIEDYRKKAKEGKFENKVGIEANRNIGVYDDGDTATNYCLSKRLNGTTFDSQDSANRKNFNKDRLTVYRFQITCGCEKNKTCAKVLPKQAQGWSGYMGSLANGYFNSRPIVRFLSHIKT